MILTKLYASPCGTLRIGSLDKHLCLCDWIGSDPTLPEKEQTDTFRDSPEVTLTDPRISGRHRKILARLRRLTGEDILEGDSEIIRQAIEQLDEYFAGIRREFTLPVLLTGTEFQNGIWRQLMAVPYGSTITYKDLASASGYADAVRPVATAVGANPHSIILPCHRIIGSDGSLTGYAGGLHAKEYLLHLERSALQSDL